MAADRYKSAGERRDDDKADKASSAARKASAGAMAKWLRDQQRATAAADKAAEKAAAARVKVQQDSYKKIAQAVKDADKAAAKSAEAQKRAAAEQQRGMMAGIRFSNRVRDQKQAEAAAQRAAEATAHAAQASENAATSAAAEAAAIGAVEAVALAAAVAVAGLVVITAKLAATAIDVVQKNSRMLRTFTALGGGARAGKEVMAVVDQLSEKLPLPRDQIAELAKNLESAGFRGKSLGKAVEAIAASTAIMGESGGAATQKMLQTLAEGGAGAQKMLQTIAKGGPKANALLQRMGLDVSDLGGRAAVAKMSVEQLGNKMIGALSSKAGKTGALSEMAQTFPVMLMKLKEGFLSLFEGLGPSVKPFMAAVQSLFGQFTRGKGPMKALGGVVTQVFGTIFKYATMAVKAVSAFVAKSFTAKNVNKTWAEMRASISKVVSVLAAVWTAIKPIVTSQFFINGLVTIFKVLAVVGAIVVGTMGAMFATMTAIAGAVAAVGSVLWGLIGQLLDLGVAIIDGVMNFDPSAFVAKMANMAQQGLAAFKSVLGIASPSSVMQQMGAYTAEGAEKGIDSGAGGVEKSAVRLGAGAASGMGKGAAGAGGKGGKGGANITIMPGALVIHAGGATITDEGLAIALERLALAVAGG